MTPPESPAGAGSEEWEAKGWVLGKVQLGVGGSRGGSRDYWSRREGNKGQEESLTQGGENLKEKQENQDWEKALNTGWKVAYTVPVLRDPKPRGLNNDNPPTHPYSAFSHILMLFLQTARNKLC